MKTLLLCLLSFLSACRDTDAVHGLNAPEISGDALLLGLVLCAGLLLIVCDHTWRGRGR